MLARELKPPYKNAFKILKKNMRFTPRIVKNKNTLKPDKSPTFV